MKTNMKMKTMKLSALAFAALVMGLISCGKDDTPTPPDTKVSVTDSIQVPFSPSAPFTLYRFKDSSVVANSDSASGNWDFGIRFVNIIVNGSVITQQGIYDSFNSAPESGYVADTTVTTGDTSYVKTAIDAGFTTGWYNYDLADPTHTFHPKAGQFFVFKTRDGHYAKMEILSVNYLPFQGPAPTTLVYKFRYTYQSDGSKNF